MSQKQMAEKLGIHWVTYSRLENLHIEPGSTELAETIGKFTKQTAGEVVDDFRKAVNS
jgi:DNA-binding XRE family transcriptional regulator